VTLRAGLMDTLWSTSAAWADFDGDGFPDLYVCHYVDWSFQNHPAGADVAPPKRFPARPHRLYRNNRDGTFTDVSGRAGLRPDGRGLGVVVADFDGDGKPDIYVANDTDENFLYLNRGGWRFEEVGLRAGVARDDAGVPNGSAGVDCADYDGSGRLSLFV